MSVDSVIISVTGSAAAELTRRMFPCCPPVRKVSLGFSLSHLPEGSVITMTVGTPVVVSFPMPAAGAPNWSFLIHVIATQTNADGTTTVIPAVGLTAASDNANLVPTLNAADNTSFWVDVNASTPLTGNITITDGAGDTLVYQIAQTEVPFVTLSGTADAPVPQPHP